MKTKIHPQYNQISVKCSCGAAFPTGSTKTGMTVDICSQCHPFFTGEMRFVDTMGRVEKYKAKQAAGIDIKAKKDKKNRTIVATSLKDMLASVTTE